MGMGRICPRVNHATLWQMATTGGGPYLVGPPQPCLEIIVVHRSHLLFGALHWAHLDVRQPGPNVSAFDQTPRPPPPSVIVMLRRRMPLPFTKPPTHPHPPILFPCLRVVVRCHYRYPPVVLNAFALLPVDVGKNASSSPTSTECLFLPHLICCCGCMWLSGVASGDLTNGDGPDMSVGMAAHIAADGHHRGPPLLGRSSTFLFLSIIVIHCLLVILWCIALGA